jgi:hypothetical protein
MATAVLIRRPLQCLTILLALALGHGLAVGQTATFDGAVARAAMQYRIVMRTLETGGREQTEAEVSLFREAWGDIIERFGKDRPSAFADDETYASTLLDIDVRLLGALLVINIGSREAAREALKPIGETLARLQERAAPPP